MWFGFGLSPRAYVLEASYSEWQCWEVKELLGCGVQWMILGSFPGLGRDYGISQVTSWWFSLEGCYKGLTLAPSIYF